MAKKRELSLEEKLEDALIPREEWPYEVPENWCWTRVDSINEYKSQSVVPQKEPDKIFELYSVPSSENNYPEIIKGSDIGSSKQAVCINDVLLCKINPRINRVWDVKGYTNNNLIASSEWIIIRSKEINSEYLKYCFQSKYFREYMLSNVSGVGGSLMRAQPKFVKTYPIPLAPLNEQTRIVNQIKTLFKQLDRAKDLIQEALDSFENRKAAILHKAFTGELTKKWRDENGFSLDSWEEYSLSDICKVNPKKINVKEYEDDLEVSFLPMPAVSDIYGKVIEPQIRRLEEVKKGYTNFAEGDILFAKITPCMENGKSAIVPKLINGIGFGSTEFHVLRCTQKVSNQFLWYLVRSRKFRDEAKEVMTGAVGQQRVPKSFLEEYRLMLPSIKEQTAIVNILDEIWNYEEQAGTCLELLENIELIKKSILAEAFRGKLDTNRVDELSSVEFLKQIL